MTFHSQASLAAQARLLVTQTVAAAQRPAAPGSTGSDHLPETYDRDAVQIALDSIVSRLNEEAARGAG